MAAPFLSTAVTYKTVHHAEIFLMDTSAGDEMAARDVSGKGGRHVPSAGLHRNSTGPSAIAVTLRARFDHFRSSWGEPPAGAAVPACATLST